jgi:hypothetical protein
MVVKRSTITDFYTISSKNVRKTTENSGFPIKNATKSVKIPQKGVKIYDKDSKSV